MKHILYFFLFFSLSVFSQNTSNYSVYLIGDAGEDTVSGKALLMLKDELLNNPNSAVVFLGDNVYPNGLLADDKNSAAHLLSQLNILKEYKGQVYFVPGNHDWNAQRMGGRKRLHNQELYVNEFCKTKTSIKNKNDAAFLPANALPGPTSVMLNKNLRLITIDTQWFLHRHRKNKTGSKKKTERLFFTQLETQLNEAKKNNEQVIITAHHPMYTNGQHSKSHEPMRFLINRTPLCILGFMGMYRPYSQDIAQPKYKRMRTRMLTVLNQYNNIIYASGHDHNLQCIMGNENRYIVSGAGSKLSHLNKKKKFDSVFQDDKKTGFVKIVYSTNGSHTTSIFRVGEEEKIIEGF